jgi:hypothetical protein
MFAFVCFLALDWPNKGKKKPEEVSFLSSGIKLPVAGKLSSLSISIVSPHFLRISQRSTTTLKMIIYLQPRK